MWVIPPDGGEASQLSHVEGDIFSYSWSNDSESIAFSARVNKSRIKLDSQPQAIHITELDYRHDTWDGKGNGDFTFFQLMGYHGNTATHRWRWDEQVLYGLLMGQA
ncbi:MAG: hypothetical protein CM1200mP35_02230 [Chloroflexota bacterium]|nr:MAG: hypothetical protein CM1200mP35_02230 [Chloroflexota bacterium]